MRLVGNKPLIYMEITTYMEIIKECLAFSLMYELR